MPSRVLNDAPIWLSCAFASLLFTRVMIRIARVREWVVRPKADRWHKSPTALYGGVAIVAGFMVCAAIFLAVHPQSIRCDLIGLFIGGLILFALGVRDDAQPLNPVVKLLGQVLAAMPFLVGLGLRHDSHVFIVGLPGLLFWMVALTNAFNLIDNMNGLSAGTAAIVGAVLSVFAFQHHAQAVGCMCGLISASCVGFLYFNFRFARPAAIFMGDCGSMFLGYMLAGLAVLAAARPITAPVSTFAVPLLVMAVPLFDTSLVIVRRKREGRAISLGGKDHSSHRLVYAGRSEKQSVVTLLAVSAIAGAGALALERIHQPALLCLGLIVAVALLANFGIFLSQYPGPSAPQASAPKIRDRDLDANLT